MPLQWSRPNIDWTFAERLFRDQGINISASDFDDINEWKEQKKLQVVFKSLGNRQSSENRWRVVVRSTPRQTTKTKDIYIRGKRWILGANHTFHKKKPETPSIKTRRKLSIKNRIKNRVQGILKEKHFGRNFSIEIDLASKESISKIFLAYWIAKKRK